MAEPKNYFDNNALDTSVNAQKRALLAAIAERGAEGQQAFETAKAGATASRQSALNAAAARGAAISAPESLNSELRDTYASLQNVGLGDSALTHDREIARIQAANDAFLTQTAAGGEMRREFFADQLAQRQATSYGGGGGGYGGGGGSSAADPVAELPGGGTLDPTNPYNVQAIGDVNAPPIASGEEYWTTPMYVRGLQAAKEALYSGSSREGALALAEKAMASGATDRRTLGLVFDMMRQLRIPIQNITSNNIDAPTRISELPSPTPSRSGGVWRDEQGRTMAQIAAEQALKNTGVQYVGPR